MEMLQKFDSDFNDQNLREKVIAIVPAFHLMRDLGISLIHQNISSARERILFYLCCYPREIVHGDELMVVSGIGEWARRVRELRIEFGWSILSGTTAKELADVDEDSGVVLYSDGYRWSRMKPEEYVLLSENLDRDAAYRWNVANSIRKSSGSVKEKILKFFIENVGKQVTGEELRYVAGDKTEWARRTRELRTEDGWPVVTRFQGREDLAIGIYVLEENRQAPAHDRRIPDLVRVEVLTRDNFACRNCGWMYKDLNRSDPRKFLELHHITHHVHGGQNIAENLITLCNVHHDEIHARYKHVVSL